MDISVVIPVYGCPGALKELHDRLVKVFSEMHKTYEIILVNDHCPKNSIDVIREICEINQNTIGLDLSRNFGQQRAIMAGLDYSSGDNVIVMDCDLQDKPEDIPQMMKKLEEGYDIVFARNTNAKKLKFTSRVFYKVYAKAANIKYDNRLSNFSVAKRVVVESLCSMREVYRAYTGYIRWLGFKTGYVDVVRDNRKEGKSGYSFKKRLKLAMDILIAQSDLPIKTILLFGIFVTISSILVEIGFLIRSIIINEFYCLITPSIFASIFLGIGTLLVSVGVIGEYISRVFNQVKNRPLYVVREKINDKNK